MEQMRVWTYVGSSQKNFHLWSNGWCQSALLLFLLPSLPPSALLPPPPPHLLCPSPLLPPHLPPLFALALLRALVQRFIKKIDVFF